MRGEIDQKEYKNKHNSSQKELLYPNTPTHWQKLKE